MPTYDYQCDSCGHKFELFQSMKDEAVRKCPKCKKLKLRRLFGTGAALVFKGSGFYQTDYRSEAYKKAAKADSLGDDKSAGSKSTGDGAGKASSDGASSGNKSSREKSSD
ncbi:MAG: zinc ribbon domain-containing protein [Pirellulales bacterium]